MANQVSGSNVSAYNRWVESQGIPVHEGYYVEDLRTLELGWWEERQCNGAFLTLAGQEGVSEARPPVLLQRHQYHRRKGCQSSQDAIKRRFNCVLRRTQFTSYSTTS